MSPAQQRIPRDAFAGVFRRPVGVVRVHTLTRRRVAVHGRTVRCGCWSTSRSLPNTVAVMELSTAGSARAGSTSTDCATPGSTGRRPRRHETGCARRSSAGRHGSTTTARCPSSKSPSVVRLVMEGLSSDDEPAAPVSHLDDQFQGMPAEGVGWAAAEATARRSSGGLPALVVEVAAGGQASGSTSGCVNRTGLPSDRA